MVGDNPEDRNWWLREGFPRLMRAGLGKGFKKDFLGSEKDNLGAMLLRLAETYMLPAQHIVPVFAEPLKITTPPGDGIELAPPDGVVAETFFTGISFEVPKDSVAVITSIHQELESPAAYNDVNIRLWYRGKSLQYWNPRKPETTPVRIVVFKFEKIQVQWENNGIIPHWLKAELVGYWFGVPRADKNQRGMTVPTQSQG